MNIHQTIALQSGGPGSGPHEGERGAPPAAKDIASLKRLGISNMDDLKKHISRYAHRYSTGGGKTLSHIQVLTKLVGPAAEHVHREFSKV